MPSREEREYDERLIRELRSKGILLDAEGHKFDSPNGAILVTCPDCDQFVDVFNYTIQMFRDGGHEERPQPLCQHGGGPLISETCPLDREWRIDEYLLMSIARARKFKDLNTLALLAHYPCGAARLAEIPLIDLLEHNVKAKIRIKLLWPELKVGCFFHMDYMDRKRTYFLTCEMFLAWFREFGDSYKQSKHEHGNGYDTELEKDFPAPPALNS